MFVDKLSETHYSQTFIKKSRKFVVKCPLKGYGLFSLRLIGSVMFGATFILVTRVDFRNFRNTERW